MISDEVNPNHAYKEVLPTELVIGGSCGCSNSYQSLI
jgi:hypothetical protein